MDIHFNSLCKVYVYNLVVMCTHLCMWQPEVESHLYNSQFYFNLIFIHNLVIMSNAFYHIHPPTLTSPTSTFSTHLFFFFFPNTSRPIGAAHLFLNVWTTSQGSGVTESEVSWRVLRARGNEYKETSFVINRAAAHMNSQPLRQHVQPLCRLKPHNIPA